MLDTKNRDIFGAGSIRYKHLAIMLENAGCLSVHTLRRGYDYPVAARHVYRLVARNDIMLGYFP